MLQYFNNLSNIDQIVFIIFVITLVIWILQMITIFFGHDFHADVNGDVDGNNTFDASFRILSITNLVNFIIASTGSYLFIPFVNITFSIIFSIVIGILMVIIMSYIYFVTSRLESPPYEYNYFDMVGLKGIVYTPISKDKPGMIHVFYNGLTREIWAQTTTNNEYLVNDEVTIVSMLSENTCSIE